MQYSGMRGNTITIVANLSIQRLLHKSIISQTDKITRQKFYQSLRPQGIPISISNVVPRFSPLDKDFLRGTRRQLSAFVLVACDLHILCIAQLFLDRKTFSFLGLKGFKLWVSTYTRALITRRCYAHRQWCIYRGYKFFDQDSFALVMKFTRLLCNSILLRRWLIVDRYVDFWVKDHWYFNTPTITSNYY